MKKKKVTPVNKAPQVPAIKVGRKEPQKQENESKNSTVPKEEPQQQPEERQKVYRPGPFAQFYELNEGKLVKEEPVWYYK